MDADDVSDFFAVWNAQAKDRARLVDLQANADANANKSKQVSSRGR